MVWPTARMRKREEMIFRARRREALIWFRPKRKEGVVGGLKVLTINLPTISYGVIDTHN